MSVKSIPVSLQDLLSELDFLGQISRGKKPCMNDMTLVDAKSWLGAFKRYLNGESREVAIRETKSIVDRAIDSIQTHTARDLLTLIVNRLARARRGIETMKTTYRYDPKIIAQINVILSNVDLQLQKNRHLIKGYPHCNKKITNIKIPKTLNSDTKINNNNSIDEGKTDKNSDLNISWVDNIENINDKTPTIENIRIKPRANKRKKSNNSSYKIKSSGPNTT